MQVLGIDSKMTRVGNAGMEIAGEPMCDYCGAMLFTLPAVHRFSVHGRCARMFIGFLIELYCWYMSFQCANMCRVWAHLQFPYLHSPWLSCHCHFLYLHFSVACHPLCIHPHSLSNCHFLHLHFQVTQMKERFQSVPLLITRCDCKMHFVIILTLNCKIVKLR